MVICTTCGTEHVVTTGHYGEKNLEPCVAALKAKLEEFTAPNGVVVVASDIFGRIEGLSARIENLATQLGGVVSSFETRVTALEGTVGQKVCFSTFDELERRVRSLESPLAVTVIPTTDSVTVVPIPEGGLVEGVTSEQLHAAVDAHLDAGGTVALEPAAKKPQEG